MRTTLTLEADVDAELQRRRRERGTTLKQEVNDLLRAGLRAADQPREPAASYDLPRFNLGDFLIPIVSTDYALRLAEGEDYK